MYSFICFDFFLTGGTFKALINVLSMFLNVCDFGLKKYTSQPMAAQLFFQEELWLAEGCTFTCQNRTRSGTLTVINVFFFNALCLYCYNMLSGADLTRWECISSSIIGVRWPPWWERAGEDSASGESMLIDGWNSTSENPPPRSRWSWLKGDMVWI